MKLVFFIFILCFLPVLAGAQEVNCNTAYKEGEDLYLLGSYDEAIDVLKRALKECRLTREEKEDFHLLLTQNYLERAQYAHAKKSVKKILRKNPDFIPKQDIYQEDMYRYFNAATVSPLVSWGYGISYNLPRFSIIEVNSVHEDFDYSAPYKGSAKAGAFAFMEFQPYDNLAFHLMIQSSGSGYSRKIPHVAGAKEFINYKENLRFAEYGFSGKKYFLHSDLKPYVSLGYYVSKIHHNGTPNISYRSINDHPAAMIREKSRHGLIAAPGINYKFSHLYFNFEVRYFHDLNPYIMGGDSKYDNMEMVVKYNYIDSKVHFSKLEFAVSLTHVLFSSVKFNK